MEEILQMATSWIGRFNEARQTLFNANIQGRKGGNLGKAQCLICHGTASNAPRTLQNLVQRSNKICTAPPEQRLDRRPGLVCPSTVAHTQQESVSAGKCRAFWPLVWPTPEERALRRSPATWQGRADQPDLVSHYDVSPRCGGFAG